MFHRHRRSTLTSAALMCMLAAGLAQADVTFARRGKLAGVIEIKDKAAGHTYHIWQSSEANQDRFEDTGHRITTDDEGNGKKGIENNDANSLMLDHYIKIGDENGPNGQPAHIVEHPEPMRPNTQTGFNEPQIMTLSQAGQSGDDILVESWNPNTMYALMLNPSEAQWLNMGCSVQGQGDLQVQLLQVTPQAIVFRVIADPTMNTIDNVIISGVGMQVLSPPCGRVGITLGYQGSASIYYNNEFLQNIAGSGQSEYDRYIVDGAPASLSSQPQDATTCPSGTAVFTAGVSGHGPVDALWQWQPASSPGSWIDIVNGPNMDPSSVVRFIANGAASTTLSLVRDNSLQGTLAAIKSVRCIATNGCGSETSTPAGLQVCAADFNCDGTTDFFDYLDFVDAFSSNDPAADFNRDGTIDFFDYLDFVDAFSSGC